MEGLPDITEILRDPCSSCAIRSASSINSIPKPYMKKKLSALPQLTVNTDITQMCKCGLHAGQQTARHHVWQRLTWCWNLMGSRAFTGTTLPYLFQSLRTYNLTLCYVHYSCYSFSLPTSLCSCLLSECVPI